MRRFILIRSEDVSGVSGVGRVAEGVEFHDGKIAMSWFGDLHSLEVVDSIDVIVAIHGHGGKTVVSWID